ncbi:MAG: DsrE family protein [Chitinophagaceae bacterium]
MQKIILFSIVLLSAFHSIAQSKHKIVFDFASGDTAFHSGILRQLNNVLKEAPDAELEVVCHGPAVFMLVKDKTLLEDKMKEIIGRAHVTFKICANSMRRLGVDKNQLISLAEVVPVAMLELSKKQQEGWSYIWAGH